MIAHAVAAPGDRWRGIAAAIACISIVGIGLSLTVPLLSLELERRGVSGLMIGLQTAVQALGSVFTAFQVPRLIGLLGPRRLLTIAILTAAAITVSFPFVDNVLLWFPLRAVLGGALTVLFVVSEYWITGVADERRRGFVMGVYATFLSIGFAVGPLLLALFGSAGLTPYVTGAVVFLGGLVPVLAAGGALPAAHGEGKPTLSLVTVIALAPVAVLAAFFFGAIESSAFSFLAIWGQRAGFAPSDAALLLTATFLGNVALQIPLGILADRASKRHLLLLCAGCATAGALLAPMLVSAVPALVVVLFLWGGVTAGLYTVGLAHLAERFRGVDLASANAAFVLNYSLGMLAGPPLAGVGLEAWSPHGLMIALAAMGCAYSVLVAVRLRHAT